MGWVLAGLGSLSSQYCVKETPRVSKLSFSRAKERCVPAWRGPVHVYMPCACAHVLPFMCALYLCVCARAQLVHRPGGEGRRQQHGLPFRLCIAPQPLTDSTAVHPL